MEEAISLKKFLKIVKRRIVIILLTIVVLTVGSGLFTYFFITPMYQASTLLLVNQTVTEGKNYSSGELQTDLELINTYNVIITSPRILKQVVEDLSLNQPYRSLAERVNVGSEGESQVVSIHVKDENPEVAMKIANSIATIFQKEIIKIMNVNNVSVLSPAEIPLSSVSPNLTLNISVGFIVGILLAIAITLFLELFDNKVRTEMDIERILDLPILGPVTNIKKENKRIQKFKKRNLRIKGDEKLGT